MQSNRAEYLAAWGEVRRLSEEARRAKWEEFLANLEGNPDPARAWNLIQSLSGSPHSTAFCEPLIHNGRRFLTNTGKANAFVKRYAAVNRLSFDKTERTQARHLKKTTYRSGHFPGVRACTRCAHSSKLLVLQYTSFLPSNPACSLRLPLGLRREPPQHSLLMGHASIGFRKVDTNEENRVRSPPSKLESTVNRKKS